MDQDFAATFNRQFDQYKDMMRRGRDVVNKAISKGRNIDKLISEKVEEFVLLEEQPLPIKVGKKTIFVGNFTYQNEQTFFHEWGMIVIALMQKLINMELLEERRKELLEKGSFELLASGKDMLEFLWMDTWFFNRITKLLKKTLFKQQAYFRGKTGARDRKVEWKNCSFRYFKKNVTKEALIQICWLIYFFNFDAEKKNLSVIINKLNMRSLAQTYMYNWLRNSDGMTGKYLVAQAPSIDSVFDDSPSSAIPPRPQKSRKDPGLEDIKEPDGIKSADEQIDEILKKEDEGEEKLDGISDSETIPKKSGPKRPA